jgi:carbon storage regulator
MLVLNRRAGEALQLGGGIRIVVLECDRGGVRIGIEAPRSVSVLREELVEAVATANRAAVGSLPVDGLDRNGVGDRVRHVAAADRPKRAG